MDCNDYTCVDEGIPTDPNTGKPVYHYRDEQCDVDPSTMLCRSCGVDHSNPCPFCHGCGFHLDNCVEMES